MSIKERIANSTCNNTYDWKTKCHTLDLYGDNIGPEGCKYLKDLKCHTLNLGYNYISDEGRNT